MTRSQFLAEVKSLLVTDCGHTTQSLLALVERLGATFDPEPDQPTVVVTFLKEVDFYSRRLLSSGQWQFRRGDGKGWVNEDPDPIQRKLAELLLDDHPAPALTFESGKWRRVEESEQPAGLDEAKIGAGSTPHKEDISAAITGHTSRSQTHRSVRLWYVLYLPWD